MSSKQRREWKSHQAPSRKRERQNESIVTSSQRCIMTQSDVYHHQRSSGSRQRQQEASITSFSFVPLHSSSQTTHQKKIFKSQKWKSTPSLKRREKASKRQHRYFLWTIRKFCFRIWNDLVKDPSVRFTECKIVAYVFFYWISHSHLFNKVDIQLTYMHKYSSSLSLVPHSLIHMLIQVISHTYITAGTTDAKDRRGQNSQSGE